MLGSPELLRCLLAFVPRQIATGTQKGDLQSAKDGKLFSYGAVGTLTCHGGIDAISKEALPLLSGVGLRTRVRHPGLPQLGAQSHRF